MSAVTIPISGPLHPLAGRVMRLKHSLLVISHGPRPIADRTYPVGTLVRVSNTSHTGGVVPVMPLTALGEHAMLYISPENLVEATPTPPDGSELEIRKAVELTSCELLKLPEPSVREAVRRLVAIFNH